MMDKYDLINELDIQRSEVNAGVLQIPFNGSNVRYYCYNSHNDRHYVAMIDRDYNIVDAKAIRLTKEELDFIKSIITY